MQTMKTQASRRLDVQGLRALAVLVVVLFHAGLPVPGGFIGVDIFFVISGFVITQLLVREREMNGRVDLRRFYLRRYKRLTPALGLMIAVVMLVMIPLGSPLGQQELAAETGIGALLLVANFVIASSTGGYFDLRAETNPLLNTWSLSVEEQFYIVFPILLIGALSIAKRRGRMPVVVIALVTVLSLGATLLTSRGYEFDGPLQYLVGFYGPLARAWEFGIGALLVFIPRRAVSRLVSEGSAWLGITMVLASLWIITPSTPGPGVRNLIPVLGTALVIWSGQRPTLVGRLLSHPGPVALGDVSYSWYLWHWPVIVIAVSVFPDVPLLPVIAAVASLIPSYLSYRWVENPLRYRSIDTRGGWGRLIAVSTGVPILVSMSVLVLNAQSFWSPAVASARASTDPHVDSVRGCAIDVPLDEIPWDECTWNTEASGVPIYLFGDSNAGQFSDTVLEFAKEAGRPVTVLAANGCPFMDVRDFGEPDPNSCAEYVSTVLQEMTERPRGTVLIASSALPWTPAEFADKGTFETGEPGPDPSYLASVLSASVVALQSEGHDVGLLQILPHFSRDPYVYDPAACSLIDTVTGNCNTRMPRGFADQMQADMIYVYRSAAESTGVPLLDLRGHICPERVCSTVEGERFRYRDGGHISVEESLALTPFFEEFLKEN